MLERVTSRTDCPGPSDAVRDVVFPLVPRILQRTGTYGLVALAVVGSASRGEETWRDGKLAGDIDLAAIVVSPDPWTARRISRGAGILSDGVELGYFPLYSLRRYRTVEFYEAKQTAWVLWGKQDVFAQVPMIEAQDIPQWEGLRLVLNRIMMCLRARAGLLPPWYAAVKLYLALGEADLILDGNYTSYYRQRWERLAAKGVVLGSQALWERVNWAMQVKLGGVVSPEKIDMREYEHWAIQGLSLLLARYLGEDLPLVMSIDRIGKDLRKPLHQGAYILRHYSDRSVWNHAIKQHPMVAIWSNAVQILMNDLQLSQDMLYTLLTDWEQTHQPFISI